MTIEDFKKAKIQAMKDKDKEAVSALNVVINKIMLASIEKKAKGDVMSDADIVSILQKTEKELEEEKNCFVKAGREETVVALDAQINTVKKFLPTMMSQEEISQIIESLEDKSMPSVMKHFKANFAGKCDMKMVGDIIKKIN